MSIPARLGLVTLGVADLGRSTAFYEALGWRRSVASTPEITFFLTAGAVLALFPRSELAAESGQSDDPPAGFTGIALAINVERHEDVADFLEVASQAGGRILRDAERADWGGVSGYFADPDGHAWEIAWNPGFTFHADGTLSLSDADELAWVLEHAGRAHHEAFAAVDGYDPEWARWYAEWLEPRVKEMRGVPVNVEELAALLSDLEQRHGREAPDEPWAVFYARVLEEALGAGD